MIEIVTIDEVDLALRLDLEEDDPRVPDILDKIDQATDAVLRYLKVSDPSYYEAPPAVKAAIILVVGSLLDDSKADLISGLGTGDPKNAVVALLYSLRSPTVA